MEKKTIFITGGASGIGKETALLFAKNDWFVGIFDVNEAGLADLAKQIGEENCCYQVLDVSQYEDYCKAVQFFADKTAGRMNVLFNNAGLMDMNFFEEIAYERHAKTVQVNVLGVVNGVYAAFELLKNTKNSRVISMCSASAIYGIPELATYSASKFFVRGFTEALNIEMERHDIWVTDIMPLYVNTPMVEQQSHEAGTLKTFGVNLTPQGIATEVWKAAHKKKVRWVYGLRLKILKFFSETFPVGRRLSMKLLSRQ